MPDWLTKLGTFLFPLLRCIWYCYITPGVLYMHACYICCSGILIAKHMHKLSQLCPCQHKVNLETNERGKRQLEGENPQSEASKSYKKSSLSSPSSREQLLALCKIILA